VTTRSARAGQSPARTTWNHAGAPTPGPAGRDRPGTEPVRGPPGNYASAPRRRARRLRPLGDGTSPRATWNHAGAPAAGPVERGRFRTEPFRITWNHAGAPTPVPRTATARERGHSASPGTAPARPAAGPAGRDRPGTEPVRGPPGNHAGAPTPVPRTATARERGHSASPGTTPAHPAAGPVDRHRVAGQCARRHGRPSTPTAV
jgi:hypothetical protein